MRLDNNEISSEGTAALFDMLSENDTLEVLTLHDNGTPGAGTLLHFHCLRSLGRRLISVLLLNIFFAQVSSNILCGKADAALQTKVNAAIAANKTEREAREAGLLTGRNTSQLGSSFFRRSHNHSMRSYGSGSGGKSKRVSSKHLPSGLASHLLDTESDSDVTLSSDEDLDPMYSDRCFCS